MMKQTEYRSFLRWHLIIPIAVLLIAAFNWFVDPYDIHHDMDKEGITKIKPALKYKHRMKKAYAVNRIKPKAIILGSSRGLRLPTEHPGWTKSPVYNLSLPAARAYEIMRYFQHAHAAQPLKQVVLSLDFFTFNVYAQPGPDFREGRLNVTADNEPNKKSYEDFSASLFSLDSLTDSVKTLTNQPKKKNKNAGQQKKKKTQKNREVLREKFLSTDENFMRSHLGWFPQPHRQYSLIRPRTDNTTISSFRTIVAIAYRDNIDLRIFISPSHAYLLEAMHAVGIWTLYEEWKKMLVKANDEEARRSGRNPFPLWDFSSYNSITTEAIPANEDPQQRMTWFKESSHYTKNLAQLILDRVLSPPVSNHELPDDFGILLTANNVDAHLHSIRQARELYVANHPEDIADIRKLAKEKSKRAAVLKGQ